MSNSDEAKGGSLEDASCSSGPAKGRIERRMVQTPIEELLKRCGSVYKLVILAAKRAKEISEGSPPLVESREKKVTSLALEEILHGRVLYKVEEPAGAGKKGRGAKAKEEKKRAA